jgi:hypothetical protein
MTKLSIFCSKRGAKRYWSPSASAQAGYAVQVIEMPGKSAGSRTTCGRLTGAGQRPFVALELENLVDQEKVREQRAEMNRGVQVVDQLGTDRGLGQNQPNGGERVVGIAIEDRQKRLVLPGGMQAVLFYRG